MQRPPIPDPFSVDYAPTGRASCKECSGFIKERSIRFIRKVRSPWHEGFDYQHFHWRCRKRYDPNLADIVGWDDLRWADVLACADANQTPLDTDHPAMIRQRDRSQRVWAVREQLEKQPIRMLMPAVEHNGIVIHKPKPAPVAAVLAEQSLFGRLPLCPLCATRSLRRVDGFIGCTGHVSGATRCPYN
eukprot:GHVU01098502.1.p1 GENE.GHVU01098502.1~~GHVU01098502.1.p1  ORF type:complete len:188 (+),score=18.92 GHVU01098502.1:639-1202(+)